MQSNIPIHTLSKNSRQRRGAALYILVVTMSVLISVIGLAGMNLMRLQRDQMLTGVEMQRARLLSRSAFELGLDHLKNNNDWRSTYSNGVETTPLQVHSDVNGTISWIVQDSDGDLTNVDVALKLLGIGRINNTVQVSSLELTAQELFGPEVLRSYTLLSGAISDLVTDTFFTGQYFKATLPPEATGWRVTSVELYCLKYYSDQTLTVRICQPDAFNLPTATNYDSNIISSNNAPATVPDWMTIIFSGDSIVDPDDGVCVMLETDNWRAPITYYYKQGGVAESNSAYIAGSPTGLTSYSDSSLLFRIHGEYYTDSSSGPTPIAGTWQRSTIP